MYALHGREILRLLELVNYLGNLLKLTRHKAARSNLATATMASSLLKTKDGSVCSGIADPHYQGNLTEVPTMTTSARTRRYIGERNERSMIARMTESTTSTTTTMSQMFAFIAVLQM
jgi:hypothetical protein